MTTESPPNPSPSPTTEAPPTSPTPSDSAATQAAPSTTDLGTDDAKPHGKANDTGGLSTDLGAEPEEPKESEAPAPPWAEFHGAPPEGEDYAITAPDGYAVDDALKAEFVPVARELNLSAKGAQRLVDLKAKDIQLQTERWGAHLTELRGLAQSDPEIGGAKYDESVAAGRRVISKFGTPGLRKVMNDYGVGAHPEMIRFMRKVDAAMGEPSTLPSGEGPGVVTEKPLHEILYKDT